MPLYEYRCQGCHRRFEALVASSSSPAPACAHCGAEGVEKLISAFAVATSSGSGSRELPAAPAGCGTCGDPRGPGSCRTDG